MVGKTISSGPLDGLADYFNGNAEPGLLSVQIGSGRSLLAGVHRGQN